MGIQIVNGQGNGGNAAGVTAEGRLSTSALTYKQEFEANFHHEATFQITDTITPTTSGDYFVYMKNEDDKALIIEEILVWTEEFERIEIIKNPEGTPTGADVTPNNCNFGSAKKAIGTFKLDTQITGLTDGPIVDRFVVQGGSQSSIAYYLPNFIILTRNTTIGFKAQQALGEIDISIPFFYEGSLHRL